MTIKYSHDELVEQGAKYLARNHAVVLTELTFGRECPDVIGWKANGQCTVIECKTTIADYRADACKPFRANSEMGMGDKRFFLTNPSLISGSDWPISWGVIEVKKERFTIKKRSMFFIPNRVAENQLMISSIRRLADAPKIQGISINFYKIDRQVRSTLGVL